MPAPLSGIVPMVDPSEALPVCTALRLKAPTERLLKEKAPVASLVAVYLRPSFRVDIWTDAFGTVSPDTFRTVPVTLPRAFMKISMFRRWPWDMTFVVTRSEERRVGKECR